jgi:endo-1,4-beta-xylanase
MAGKMFAQNEGRKPVIVEVESGNLGSNFTVRQSDDVTYVSVKTDLPGNSPGDTSRTITYQVTFKYSGSYNFFVRLRVGPNGFDDDSFFYGNGFGVKNAGSGADWILVNGLGSSGFSDPKAFVDGPGTLGSNVWKWVNLTKNGYQGTAGNPFKVTVDNLTKTFQIGGCEDGLDIDKFAFGKSNVYFTVEALNNGLPGSITMQDTGTVWQGPALATGQSKFLGCGWDGTDPYFIDYWTQLTPGNAGKFGSVATTANSSQWNWGSLDAAYDYAKNNHLIFKDHCLIWGQQQPGWITNSGLDSSQQADAIEQWIRLVGERYPEMDMVDVVNEPLIGHNPAPYRAALGGNGATGWDWVIWAFQKARDYMPNAKLLLNDYGIINDNNATTSYLKIINLLKDRNLIDGIGVQGHRFELESADTTVMRKNLDRLAATGLPVYISEFDLGNLGNSGTPNDDQQLQLYKKIFPVLWKHPGVKGITIWGYRQGQVWQSSTYLVRWSGTARPALLWLAEYIKDNPTGVNETASASPSNYQLDQNYPNPFNPSTNIRYSIVKPSKVTVKVFDILGREVQTLVNAVHAPGQYTVPFNAQDLASGIYFYRIHAGSFTAIKKCLLVK